MIRKAEIKYEIPKGLLQSIAQIESNMHPWTVNSTNGSLRANTMEEAISFIQQLQSQNITNIDIGITQINMRWHNSKFERISDMLDPQKNIEYAAKLLASLYEEHKDWYKATAYYHSYNPIYYQKYSKKVLMKWLNLST
jgi:soluble lytic murein transglycosylase-like protein